MITTKKINVQNEYNFVCKKEKKSERVCDCIVDSEIKCETSLKTKQQNLE